MNLIKSVGFDRGIPQVTAWKQYSRRKITWSDPTEIMILRLLNYNFPIYMVLKWYVVNYEWWVRTNLCRKSWSVLKHYANIREYARSVLLWPYNFRLVYHVINAADKTLVCVLRSQTLLSRYLRKVVQESVRKVLQHLPHSSDISSTWC